ncbi:MAG: bifunctional adenosylcobinamide kinase/adenosylcobinamide-phosphate guanylyltransferase [Lachnospiraceae bacterium]
MITVVIGASGSGKSEYAENQALTYQGTHYYIATMEPYGEEGAARIARHHKLRKNKGFQTIECYTHLEELQFSSTDVVLLECISNLTANEMFKEGTEKWNLEQRVLQEVWSIANQVGTLIIVSNDVSMDGLSYGEDLIEYIRAMSYINKELAQRADRLVEVVCGVPLIRKGGKDEFN